MRTLTPKHSMWSILYGLFYGGVVAFAYFFIRLRGHNDGGLSLFALTCLVAFLLHVVLWPRQTLRGFADRKMFIRGLLFGITQVLIFKAQSHGHTSTALVASTLGSVFGVLLGRIFLKERIQGFAAVAVVLCMVAVFMNPLLIVRAYWGVLGGFIQGTGFVLARALMLNKKSMRQSISTGLGMGLAVAVVALFVSEHTLPGMGNAKYQDLLITTILLLVIQYGFFQLYKVLDTQRASILTLSRLPWIVAIEALFLGTVIAYQQMISATLIGCAALILVLEAGAKRLQRR